MRQDELLGRVRRRLADTSDDAGSSGLLGAAVRGEVPGLGTLADDTVLAELHRQMSAELVGAGPLEALLALPGVTDVLVNSADEVWLDRGQGLERAPVRFPDDASVRRLAQRLAAATGRRLDDASPFIVVRIDTPTGNGGTAWHGQSSTRGRVSSGKSRSPSPSRSRSVAATASAAATTS